MEPLPHKMLHITIIVFALFLSYLSIKTYFKVKNKKFLFVCLAFLLFMVRELILFGEVVLSMKIDVVLPLIHAPLTHFLSLLILIFFSIGIFIKKENELNILSLIKSNIRRNTLRTSMLVLSVVFLVFILSFFTLAIVTVNKSLEAFSEKLGADILVVPKGSSVQSEEFLLEGQLRAFYMDKSIYEKIKGFESIEKITYQIYLGTLPALCCGVPELEVVAIDPETDFIVKPWIKGNVEIKRGEAFAGIEAIENLGLVDTALLFGKDFNVVGVLERTKTGLDYSLFIREDDLMEIIKKNPYVNVKENQISAIFIKVRDGYDVDKLAEKIEKEFPQVDVIRGGEIGSSVKRVISNMSKIFSVVLVVSSVLSVLLIANIFTMIINERRREIGILRALGASNRGVMKVLLLESVFLGIIGSSLGIIFGLILGWKLLLSSFHLPFLEFNPAYTALIAFLGVFVGVLLSCIGVLIPISKIRKIEPLLLIKED